MLKRKGARPCMVAHTCNPSYVGGRERRIMFRGQSRPKKKKFSEPWWCICVIPATQKAYVGGFQSKANPGKKVILYLKNNKAQRTGGVT
jgi:hypothetical protein